MMLPIRSISIILATCLLAAISSCKKPLGEDGDQEDINKSITITVDTSGQVLADGDRLIRINYTLTHARAADYFTPVFPEAGGTQIGLSSGKVYLANDTASSYIRTSVVPGTYLLAIQLNALTETLRQIPIRTLQSLPDTLLVEADKTLADTIPGSVVNFSVFLQKQHGKVSKETSISARAFQLRGPAQDTVAVGRFTGLVNNKSDENGKIVLQFFTDTRDFDNSKIVKLLFWSNKNNGTVTKTLYSLPIK